jgi:hypothetical protein
VSLFSPGIQRDNSKNRKIHPPQASDREKQITSRFLKNHTVQPDKKAQEQGNNKTTLYAAVD